MPAVFVGHGNPMNAIQANDYTKAWEALAAALPRPRAILSVSAHWYLPGGRVTDGQRPRTIHDFGGFPPELYQVRYPAPGSPELARRVRDLLTPTPVELDERWGLIMAPGRSWCTCSRRPTCPWRSWASTRP